VVERLEQRERRRRVTGVEFSVEVDAPPERVWDVASDPANLPQWDRHILRVRLPGGGLAQGVRYEVDMGFMAVQTTVRAFVLEWEAPWRASIHLDGLIEGVVTTSIASLPYDRSVLRHEVDYRFKGPLGRFGATSLNMLGGAQLALRHGVLAQKRQIEAAAYG
jgi:carbon monoxide dehydrogenase subunit G